MHFLCLQHNNIVIYLDDGGIAMSLTLEFFYQKTRYTYNLDLLTTSTTLNKKITWVYLLDDVHNSSFIRGGELIITTGLITKSSQKLDHLINEAYIKGACGAIINTGMYIKNVPSRIIEFGEENNFPIFSMPWETHIADIMQEYCNEIISEQKIASLKNNVFLRSILHSSSSEDKQILSQFIGFRIAASKMPLNILYFAKVELDNIYYYICSAKSIHTADHSIGLSNQIESIDSIHQYYIQAYKALKVSIIKRQNMFYFSDIGLYDIALSIDDKYVYKYAHQLLSQINDSELLNTLRIYLECNGSVNLVASKLFVHRNTINYRIHQIKEQLGIDLDIPENRLKYLFAFYLCDCDSINFE